MPMNFLALNFFAIIVYEDGYSKSGKKEILNLKERKK